MASETYKRVHQSMRGQVAVDGLGFDGDPEKREIPEEFRSHALDLLDAAPFEAANVTIVHEEDKVSVTIKRVQGVQAPNETSIPEAE